MDWIYKIQRHASLTSSEIRAVALISLIIIVGSVSRSLSTESSIPSKRPALHASSLQSKELLTTTDTLKHIGKQVKKEASPIDTLLTSIAGNKIDLNTAKVSQLVRLKGIGPSLAKRIVDYREENGPFQNPEDIIQVKGIGKAKLAAIKDHIMVKENPN